MKARFAIMLTGQNMQSSAVCNEENGFHVKERSSILFLLDELIRVIRDAVGFSSSPLFAWDVQIQWLIFHRHDKL